MVLSAYSPARARALADLFLSDYEVDLSGPTPVICVTAVDLEEVLGAEEELDQALPEANPAGERGPALRRTQGLEERDQYLQDLVRAAVGATKAQAKSLASAYPGAKGLLFAQVDDLVAAGLTEKQAKRLHAAMTMSELARSQEKHPQLRSPSDAARWLRSYLSGAEQEQFIVILLDARQKPFHAIHVARGSLAHVDVHPRDVFRDAVRLNAHAVIIAHNHPSGSAAPSQADIALTRRMVEVGQLVGIPVLDSLIVADHETASLAALGLVPTG